MTTMGVAPRIVVAGPLPRPPLYGLLAVAQEAEQDPHWGAGAYVHPYPAALPSAVDPCASGTFRDKDVPDETAYPEAFPTFTAYLGEVCSSIGIGADWSGFTARANAALAARDQWALERQLVDAQFVDAPHLGDDNVDVLASGAAVAVVVAIAYLEDAIAATGQDGLIHLTPSVAAALGSERLRDDRGLLRTTRGTPVTIGNGYVGADVPTPNGTPAASPAAGQSWIYASGPVLYRRGDLFAHPSSYGEALDRDDNTVIYRAERDLWVAWDAQLQAAVLADWSP